MKKTLIWVIAAIAFVALVWFLIDAAISKKREKESNETPLLEAENQRLQSQIDSLLLNMSVSETRVDTIWMWITQERIRYDTIIMRIPIMPPIEQLAVMDSLTGLDIEKSLVAENYAMVALPRIERIAIGLLERDIFKKESKHLRLIINEQTGQISTLREVIVLHEQRTENAEEKARQTQRQKNIERLVGGVLLIIFLIK